MPRFRFVASLSDCLNLFLDCSLIRKNAPLRASPIMNPKNFIFVGRPTLVFSRLTVTFTGKSGSNPGGDETRTANEGQQVQGLEASDYQEETVTSKDLKDKFNFHKYDNGTKIDLSLKQNEKEMQNDDGSITLTHVNKGPVMKKDGRVAPFGLIDIKLVRSI